MLHAPRQVGKTTSLLSLGRDHADPLPEGIAQLDEHLAGLGLDAGWLVIFDRRPGAAPIAERLGATTETANGRCVTVVRA
ncbi:MAG: hypothetical protein U0441_24195 [Polyangiaceae bacterium]